MRSRIFQIVAIAILVSLPAAAGPYGDALGKCLVSSTTSAEKTTLVQWMFTTLSLHPDVQAFTAVTAQQRQQTNKRTAHIFEHLLTEACARETKDAIKYEGQNTLESAFSLLGQVAMRELFANPKVAAGLEDLGKSFDQEKLKSVFQPEK